MEKILEMVVVLVSGVHPGIVKTVCVDPRVIGEQYTNFRQAGYEDVRIEVVNAFVKTATPSLAYLKGKGRVTDFYKEPVHIDPIPPSALNPGINVREYDRSILKRGGADTEQLIFVGIVFAGTIVLGVVMACVLVSRLFQWDALYGTVIALLGAWVFGFRFFDLAGKMASKLAGIPSRKEYFA